MQIVAVELLVIGLIVIVLVAVLARMTREGRRAAAGEGLRLVTSSAFDQLELGINDPTESCRLLTVNA